MSSLSTRGLVLSVIDHGESDKIVTFFSQELGKVTGIAKGAKRSKQRFVNKLEEFSLLQVMYRAPRQDGLLFLVEAELEEAFLALRKDFRRYTVAMYVIELVVRFTREHDPDKELFSLLLWALLSLENGNTYLQTGTLFHLRLLGTAGYQPDLSSCGFCGKEVTAQDSFSLHPETGSLVCETCRKNNTKPFASLSVRTLKFLDYAQRLELKNLDRLRIPEKNTHEALSFLYHYTRHLLQRELNSWQQIKALIAT